MYAGPGVLSTSITAFEAVESPVPEPPMPVRLSEDTFIEWMARLSRGSGPRPVVGIGDDAAVLSLPRRMQTLLTTDFLTEGVHFRFDRMPPRLLGRKAMA